MKLPDRLDVSEVFELYLNGNITETRRHIKRMTRAEFLDFVEYARENSVMPHKLRILVEEK